MNQNTIVNILGIAPNEAIKNTMLELSSTIEGIKIDPYVGNLEQGLDIVQNHSMHNFDVILARGKTASIIKEHASLPVLEIPYSISDIFHAVTLAESHHTRFAILGYPCLTEPALQLKQLLNKDFAVYTLTPSESVFHVLEILKRGETEQVITDACISSTVKSAGLKDISILSSRETIFSVLMQSLPLCTGYSSLRKKALLLDAVIQSGPLDTLIYDQNQDLVYNSVHNLEPAAARQLTIRDLKTHQENEWDRVKVRGNHMIHSSKRCINQDESDFTVFYLNPQKQELPAQKNGITFLNPEQTSKVFLRCFKPHLFPLDQNLSWEPIASSPLPVLITGEPGTGHDEAAAYLYTHSTLAGNPFVLIDLNTLGDRSWHHLLNHVDSPFNTNKQTIYLKGLKELSHQKAEQLFSFIRDSSLCLRNRVFFSCTTGSEDFMPANLRLLKTFLSCVHITLMPLRSHPQDIDELFLLYWQESHKELPQCRMDPKITELLKNTSWPQNQMHLRHVAANACSFTYQDISESLEKELRTARNKPLASSSLNLKKPLAEIEKDIIYSVLNETKGNQSQAAARLGICRTTLWRILNKT